MTDFLSEISDKLVCENNEEKIFNWDEAPFICEINGYGWYLGPEAPNAFNWDDAVEWCNSVGGELPPRDILLHCYMNEEIKKEFTETYYWSSTEFSDTHAWGQHFKGGYQGNNCKTGSYYVRAVRKLPGKNYES